MTFPRTLLTIVTVLALSAPAAAGAQSDAQQERDDVRRRQAETASELDVLQASNAEIDAVLDDIESAIVAQQDELAAAEAARAQAELAVRRAEDELRAARRDVRLLEEAIREMAIASYIHPPTADLVQSLEAVSFSDALLQRAYLDARAKRDVGLLDLLEAAELTAAERAADLEAAAADAARAVEEAGAALAQLRAEEAEQVQFAARLQERIDASLAEAAVLADLDAELAEQIQAEQAALIARIPPPPPPVEPAAATRADPPRLAPDSTEPPSSSTTTTPSTPSAPSTPGTAPTTTTPRPPPVSTATPPLRTVQGITVHADIADDVDALLTAARDAGVALAGWGYRSTDRQIQLRTAHCGPTYYDIWQKPASLCSPPTAVPGRSLHEQGRAIDFTHEGRAITSRSTVAFRWLADNAASYGLFNLPSEPWHWSTNGG